MYPNLKDIGVRNPQSIKRYSLRQEGDTDILKIYFRKQHGMLISRSSKYIFQRHIKKVSGGQHKSESFTNLSEINPTLRKIIAELDSLSVQSSSEQELKREILSDLKHLKLVVDGKIEEIESKLEQLEKKS